jgi:hypothetical protein
MARYTSAYVKIPCMALRKTLSGLDARFGLAPKTGESWLKFLARTDSRRPLTAALGEVDQRLAQLERRVADLEARNQ